MPELIRTPTRIPVPGGKAIHEYVGRATTGETALSMAHMVAPPGWTEPFQTPQFDEYTLVLRGVVRVEDAGGATDVHAGQAVVTRAGQRGSILHCGRRSRVRSGVPAGVRTRSRPS
jgi:mannose-6-phosphate isomerase-like protein (cupin superfamily)